MNSPHGLSKGGVYFPSLQILNLEWFVTLFDRQNADEMIYVTSGALRAMQLPRLASWKALLPVQEGQEDH